MPAKKIESSMCHALRVPLGILGDPSYLTCPPPAGNSPENFQRTQTPSRQTRTSHRCDNIIILLWHQ